MTRPGLTPEQLARRSQGLGGSDAAAVLGVSPWRTPLDVYLDKTGQAGPVEPTPAMEWGNRLEDAVADAAAERLGVRLRRRHKTLARREHPWMLAHLDREVIGQPAIVEIKTAGFRDDDWGEEGTDQVPRAYVAQAAHYMAVRDRGLVHLAVLFLADRRLCLYRIGRDPELEQVLVEAERRFWHDHVLARVPPEPATLADVRKRWPRDEGGCAVATDGIERAVERLRDVRDRQKALEAERADLEKGIQRHMEACAELVGQDGRTLATWRSQTARRLDAKALEAAHPELAAQFRRETHPRAFRLKQGA